MNKAINYEVNGKVTWGEIKKLFEASGVKDHEPIDRIDVAWGNIEDIKITYDEDYGWQVYL